MAKKAPKKEAPKKEAPKVEVEKTSVTTESIVREIAASEDLNMSQAEVKSVLKKFENIVTTALSEGKKVQVTGFFSAEPTYRSSRMANNVATGEPMEVPESMGVSIRAGQRLKDAAGTLNPADYKK